jgi:cytochrome c-type biogenesis protein CcmH
MNPTQLRRFALSIVVAVAVIVGLGATDTAGRFNDLGHKMMCTCGCAQVLLECNHVGCTTSTQMRAELQSQLATGNNDSLILQSFVQRYGATVLAAPGTSGFDLIAWIMPFAVSLLALIGTVYLVRNWARQTRLAPTGGARLETLNAQDEMRERIRRETGADEGE